MALVVLDTDVASHLIKGTLSDALKAALVGQQPLISFVTVGELARWIHLRELGERRRRAVDRWIGSQHVIGGSPEVARRWGEITAHAIRRGRPRPNNDAWIAAVCLHYDWPLATLNVRDYADFVEHEGLRLVPS